MHFLLGMPPVIVPEMIDIYRPILTSLPKDPPPRHRRKRKDEEVATSGTQTQRESVTVSKGPQFDLVDSAFPPLPGNF